MCAYGVCLSVIPLWGGVFVCVWVFRHQWCRRSSGVGVSVVVHGCCKVAFARTGAKSLLCSSPAATQWGTGYAGGGWHQRRGGRQYCKPVLHGKTQHTRTAGMMFLSRRRRLLTTRARRATAPALMLISPVVRPPAGRVTVAWGQGNIMSCTLHPTQRWCENTWGAAGLPGAGTMPYW